MRPKIMRTPGGCLWEGIAYFGPKCQFVLDKSIMRDDYKVLIRNCFFASNKNLHIQLPFETKIENIMCTIHSIGSIFQAKRNIVIEVSSGSFVSLEDNVLVSENIILDWRVLIARGSEFTQSIEDGIYFIMRSKLNNNTFSCKKMFINFRFFNVKKQTLNNRGDQIRKILKDIRQHNAFDCGRLEIGVYASYGQTPAFKETYHRGSIRG